MDTEIDIQIPALAGDPAPVDHARPHALPPASLCREDVFWAFWQRIRPALLGYCIRVMGGNRADAEDALSIAAIKAFQKYRTQHLEIADLRAWLKHIAFNACMDLYRERKQASQMVTDSIEGRLELYHTRISTLPSPEEELGSRQTARILHQTLGFLPPNLREPFVLRVLRGMAYADIAHRLEIKNATVRKRVQLARDRLHQAMRQRMG